MMTMMKEITLKELETVNGGQLPLGYNEMLAKKKEYESTQFFENEDGGGGISTTWVR